MKPILALLTVLSSPSISAPTDTSTNHNTASLPKRDTPGNVLLCNQPNWQDCELVHYNITNHWPCIPLPPRFDGQLGSIAPETGTICRVWSSSVCSEMNLIALTWKPGEPSFHDEDGVDWGRQARYIGCAMCTNCD